MPIDDRMPNVGTARGDLYECPKCHFMMKGDVFRYMHELGYCTWTLVRELVGDAMLGKLLECMIDSGEILDELGIDENWTKEEVRAWIIRTKLERNW